ncbi:MAG: 50S ribosomal protein L6, partial [Candidatus Cloacimonadota bacterium]
MPEGVKAEINKNKITISGKLGKLEYNLLDGISVREENGLLFVSRSDDTKEQKSFHGLTRALINNMVIGVSKGYEKVLQVIGTGYTAETVGPWLKLNVGYSHEILLEIPEGIK